mmetsp:Transcript_21082/g.60440  ORF Transcript_21082/g.60440 Transcript_21082/m.60440 type:complete len:125 (-) Transcript_21082:44-418(-)
MRWGLFWSKLRFPLPKVGPIVISAMKVHSFLIDEREGADGISDREYWTEMYPSLYEMALDGVDPSLLETGNRPDITRPTVEWKERRERGKTVRGELRDKLREAGMERIGRSAIHRNEYGHVYTI